jgi:hypothetical protein
MSTRILTVQQALVIGEVITAVAAGQKVTVMPSGDREQRIVGTLRHLSPANGSAAHFGNGDVRDAWVRITTVQGFETWIRLTELVQAVSDSEAALGVAYQD